MKYLIITLFFCTFAQAQEYNIYRFPSVTPEYVVKDNGYLYEVDDFYIIEDFPQYKIEDNRIYEVDDFGIIDYEQPIIIETETWDTKQIYRKEKSWKRNDSGNLQNIFSKRLGKSQMEKYLLRDF